MVSTKWKRETKKKKITCNGGKENNRAKDEDDKRGNDVYFLNYKRREMKMYKCSYQKPTKVGTLV